MQKKTWEELKAAHSISERPIREAKTPSSKWPSSHKSNSEFKQIYYSFISIHYKLNLPRETDAIWTSQVHMTVENQLVNPASFANCASPRTTSHLTLINCFRTTGAKWRCVRIWLYFFIPKSGRKYSHTNSYNSAMTFISQDDHLTAGAWAVCARTCREKQTQLYTNLNHHEDQAHTWPAAFFSSRIFFSPRRVVSVFVSNPTLLTFTDSFARGESNVLISWSIPLSSITRLAFLQLTNWHRGSFI